jgi:hypothetical protein
MTAIKAPVRIQTARLLLHRPTAADLVTIFDRSPAILKSRVI